MSRGNRRLLGTREKRILGQITIRALAVVAIAGTLIILFPPIRTVVLVLAAVPLLFFLGMMMRAGRFAIAARQLDKAVDRVREDLGEMRLDDDWDRIPYQHVCVRRDKEHVLFAVDAITEGERQLFSEHGDRIAQEVMKAFPEYDKAACVQNDYTSFFVECWDSSKTSQSLYVKHVEKPQGIWDEWTDASPEEVASPEEEVIRQLDQAIDRVCAELGMAGPSSAQSRMPYDHKCSERSGDRIVLEIHATSEGERQLLTKHGDRVAQAVVRELPEYDAAACVQTSYDGFCVECWDSSKTSQSLHDKPVEKPQSVWDDPDAYFARHAEDAV